MSFSIQVNIIIQILLSFSMLSSCINKNGSSQIQESVLENQEVISPVVIVDTMYTGLTIYYPKTDSISLRCFERPDPATDPDIIFCCAAAFTLDYETKADHSRICSAHVSDGVYYKKPRSSRYTGAFVTSKGEWSFLYNKDADPNAFHDAFNKAAENKGAGFAQEMMIHQGVQVKTTRPLSNVNLFRAVCEKDNKLCIIDAKESGSFGNFIKDLLNAGVTEAIYTDMGYGWNYSWYREFARQEASFIHPEYQKSATNWLVFYAK